MPIDISFQPMRVVIDGHDTEGKLVLADDQLAAVLVRLDGTHHDPAHKGWWHLEAGFGKLDIRNVPLFRTADETGAWVERTPMGKAARCPEALYETVLESRH